MKKSPNVQIVNRVIDRTPKVLEDFIDFLKDKIHHGEVIEVPTGSFLAIFVNDENNQEILNTTAAAMGAIFEELDQHIPVAIFPTSGGYRLQVYEGDVYVGVRDSEQEGPDTDESP